VRTRVCAFLLALAVSAAPALGAVATTKYALTNSGWTDLGAGPLLLGFNGTGVFAIGDTTPTLVDEGFGIRAARSFPVKTTSHVWARATPGAFSVSAYAAPITGGGSTGCTQATSYLARATGEVTHAADLTTLICGLVTDGVWSKLDALYVFAQQTRPDAQLNLISATYNLPTTAATWTAYQGMFVGGGQINTGFNIATAPSPHIVQNSGNIMVWAYNTPSDGSGEELGSGSTLGDTELVGNDGTNNFYCYIAVGSGPNSYAVVAPTGLIGCDRTGAAHTDFYFHGANFASTSSISQAPNSNNLLIGPTSTILSEASWGSSLGAAGNLALYNRLRAYMTAVGVP
jgi:hypothetical protein